VFRKTIAELLAVGEMVTFWYCSVASLPTPACAGMIGGLMTRVVPPAGTLMTRKVFSWPVDCLVILWTAKTPAIVKESPAATFALVDELAAAVRVGG